MRVGIADHFGWAIAVTASSDHEVVDRRRLELVEPGVTAAPIHYDSHRLDVAGTAALVAHVRAGEPGCLLYALHHGAEPGTYVFMERYADQAAVDAHRATDYFKALGRKMGEYMDGRAEVLRLREVE